MKRNLTAIALIVFLSACSSVQTSGAPAAAANLAAAGPYVVHVSAPTPQLEQLLQEYVLDYFGKDLVITDGTVGRGSIDVTFTSDSDANGFSKWQNSTTLMVIRGADQGRLWSGEYDYKGGMEMSGFRVNSAAEAAKLVVQRLAKRLEADHSR